MSFDAQIRVGEYIITFEYVYDYYDDMLVLDSHWTAWDKTGQEVMIPDLDLADEIEEEVELYLKHKNNDIGTDYRQKSYTGEMYE